MFFWRYYRIIHDRLENMELPIFNDIFYENTALNYQSLLKIPKRTCRCNWQRISNQVIMVVNYESNIKSSNTDVNCCLLSIKIRIKKK